MQQPFRGRDVLTPARKISNLVRKLVLGRIPLPPPVSVRCSSLRVLFHLYMDILERGQRVHGGLVKSLIVPHLDREVPAARWRRSTRTSSTSQGYLNPPCGTFHHQCPLYLLPRHGILRPPTSLLRHTHPSRRAWFITCKDRIVPRNFWTSWWHIPGAVPRENHSTSRVEESLFYGRVLFHSSIRYVPCH